MFEVAMVERKAGSANYQYGNDASFARPALAFEAGTINEWPDTALTLEDTAVMPRMR